MIGNALCAEGTEVHYTPPEGGMVGDNLSPLNDAAQDILDGQKDDHPDKTGSDLKHTRDEEAVQKGEKDETDGPVPKKQKGKGDTRTPRKAPPKKADKTAKPSVTPIEKEPRDADQLKAGDIDKAPGNDGGGGGKTPPAEDDDIA